MILWNTILVLLLVAANGFFVAAEFALVKVRASEIGPTGAGRKSPAGLVRHMLGHLDAYLSACQLGITLASLGLGWVGEPLVARMIEPAFAALGLPEEKVHYVAFPIAFAAITFLHLTLGEQAPKIAAIQKARAISLLTSYPLALFYAIFRPFIWLINVSSNSILWAVGLKGVSEHEAQITEGEVRVILTESAAKGHLTRREHRIIEGVLDLEDKPARRYMLPRNKIVYINKRDPLATKLETVAQSGHTRFPVCEGSLDHVVGIVHVKDIFKAMTAGDPMEALAPYARDPLFLPENLRLDKLLLEFQRTRNHLAVLLDEYGGVAGMITLENVLEEMIGPIQDEFDAEKPLIVKTGPGRWEVDAGCPVDRLSKSCGLEVPAGSEADSTGGLMIEALGRIPKAGEAIGLGGFQVTALETEPRRVLRVLVEKEGEVGAPEHGAGTGGGG